MTSALMVRWEMSGRYKYIVRYLHGMAFSYETSNKRVRVATEVISRIFWLLSWI